ncbi:MAG: hypothetical protein ACKV2T_22570 [Kofleriaceae bacterium]
MATLLLAGVAGCADDNTSEDQQAVKCEGINECKGTSECAGPDGANDCQGMNTCEGMGWISVETEKECTDKGGTVI